MARKFFLFILLVVVWAALYLMLSGGESASFSALFFAPVHPAEAAIPHPWQNQTNQVRLSAPLSAVPHNGPSKNTQPENALCAAQYQVQRGDTLGQIAQRCGVRLADLQALNPEVTNPNRIYPGQQLTVYAVQPETSANSIPTGSHEVFRGARPGSVLDVYVEGLPPQADCQIGIGLSRSGFAALAAARTDQHGVLKTQVVIPGSAVLGDQAFILVTVRQTPAVQRVSESFEILP